MVNWNEVIKAYEQVKKIKGEMPDFKQKVQVGNATIYTMGANNPVIRIDIKEQ